MTNFKFVIGLNVLIFCTLALFNGCQPEGPRKLTAAELARERAFDRCMIETAGDSDTCNPHP